MTGQLQPPPSPAARLRRLLLAALDVYAVVPVVYLVARALWGDSPWPVALLSTFLHWLLLPAFVLLPLAVWRRRWPAALMFGAQVTAFVWLFGALFLPQAPVSTNPAPTLTVMSFNVGNGMADSDALVAVLRASEADLIALVELSAGQAATIERELRTLYPYQVLYGDGIPGKGLLSRQPIVAHERFELMAQPQLTHLRAVLEVDGVPLTVIVAHPPRPNLVAGGYRFAPGFAEEVAALAQMASAGGPALMLGDFNMTDQHDPYVLLLDAGLSDAFREGGWGFGATWPVRLARAGPPLIFPPLVRIDFVWHTAYFQAVRAWLGPDAGSDHLPLLATLAWVRS